MSRETLGDALLGLLAVCAAAVGVWGVVLVRRVQTHRRRQRSRRLGSKP